MKTKRPAQASDAPKRAALYLRISKKPNGEEDAEASRSVEDQRVRCEALCEANGYVVVATFRDDGVSAYRSLKDRPGYGDLKTALAAGAFDVLVFDRQDRLARDQTETLEFVAACRRAGIEWHSDQEGHIDLTEPMQVLFAIFRGGEAESYSTKINTNARSRNKSKREQGLPGAGGRPFGYEPDKITVRESEAELIRRGTEMILAGSARYEVLKMFRESGLKSVRGREWHVANVTGILKRWRNAGWVEHADEPHTEAVWPAIVSLDDVRNVRSILSQGRQPGRWKKPTQLCSGIAECRCGCPLMITGDDEGPAYRCSEIITRGSYSPGGHVTIGVRILDPLVRDAVVDAYFTRPASSTAGKAEAAALAKLYERKASLQQSRKEVQGDRRAGVYSRAEAAREVATIEAELAKIEAEISATAAQSAHAAMLNASMASLIIGAADGYLSEPDEDGLRSFDLSSLMIESAQKYGATREEAVNAEVRRQWAGDAREMFAESGEDIDGMDLDLDRFVTASASKHRVRADLLERFDALGLEHRRNLVRSLLRVKVLPGRGPKRVAIEPL